MSSAISFSLPEDIASVRDGLLAFARSEIIARHDSQPEIFDDQRQLYDQSGRLSDAALSMIHEVRTRSASAGYYQMCVPEHLGGGGLGHLAYFVCWEALFRLCGPLRGTAVYALAHWCFGPSRLLEKMSERAREEILAPLMDGTKSMCFGLSEPGAGSDLTKLATVARRDGKGWSINGRKIWTSNSPVADYCLLFAVTDPTTSPKQITAFIVPTSAQGFTLQRVVKMFGHIGGDEGEIVLEDLRVEDWQVVGEVGQGLSAAIYGISLGRIYNAARAVGYGRWALEKAFDYAKMRQTFGKALADHQGIMFPLVESATELHGAHLMGLNAATLIDNGNAAVKELSMAKVYAVTSGLRAIDRAVQAHGAMGLTNEIGLMEAWTKIRVINIADGTNEILNRTILQRLLKGDIDL